MAMMFNVLNTVQETEAMIVAVVAVKVIIQFGEVVGFLLAEVEQVGVVKTGCEDSCGG